MLLSSGDRQTILTALRFCAMYWDRKAQENARTLNTENARKYAAFSQECFRVAELWEKGK